MPAIAGQQRRFTGRRIDLDLEGRGHPQRPPADLGRGPGQHRHRRQRERHGHHPHAQRPLGPGARDGAPGQGPRHGPAGQHDPRRPARRSQQGARARDRAAQERAPARAARDAAHPRSTTPTRRTSRTARRTCSRRAARWRVDERTNVLIARDVARQPQPDRGAGPLARHADAAGAHRGARRGGDEPLRARRRHPVGRRRHVQRGHRQPDGPRLPLGDRHRRRRHRLEQPDRRPLAVREPRSRTRTSR